jgi:hypothetical protein
VADQEKLITYLSSGGNLYIESSDIGKDYQYTDLYDYLGFTYMNDGGDNEVNLLKGAPETMTSDMLMGYYGGTSPHYSVDHISSFGGIIFQCEENVGRMVYHEAGNYKVVSSSIVMGALANGDSLNLKPYLLAEMVFKFLDYDPTVSIQEPETRVLSAGNFPNPFNTETEIRYQLSDAGHVTVKIYDVQGSLVKALVDHEQLAGVQTIFWDATNETGTHVKPGIYIYRIQSGKANITGKMTVY